MHRRDQRSRQEEVEMSYGYVLGRAPPPMAVVRITRFLLWRVADGGFIQVKAGARFQD